MAYITQQNLSDELGEDLLVQLTDNDRIGEINIARVQRAIDYAVGIFEAHIRARYSLPVPTTAMVESICVDLAVYHLQKGRTSVDEGVWKVRKDAHDNAIKLLMAIGQGKAALDIPAAVETVENPATSDTILTNAKRTFFTDDKLSGF